MMNILSSILKRMQGYVEQINDEIKKSETEQFKKMWEEYLSNYVDGVKSRLPIYNIMKVSY